MGGNDKASVTKEQNERHRKILDALMKLPENRECADCKCKAPRWASVNLGVFLCIQCSGIHRSLGVHISKVRSATLDTWLPEQVEFIQTMGNAKANAYWEAELPETFRRPPETDRSGLEAFIRAKYEQRRWVRMNDEERSRMKASLREDDYRKDRSDRYDRPSQNGPPRRPYDPDYDRDWSHGAHASYNRGGAGAGGFDRDRKDERYDRYDRKDRYDSYGGRDDRDRGGRHDGYGGGGYDSRGGGYEGRGGGHDSRGYDSRDRGRSGDYGGGYRERDEPRGPPRPDPREQRPVARAPPPLAEPGRPAAAPRAAPKLTVPLPGAAPVAPPAAAAAPAAASAAPAPAAPPAATAQVNKTADLFDLLNVNDPPPVPGAAPAPAPASTNAFDAWAAFPADPSQQGATAAPAAVAANSAVPGGLAAFTQPSAPSSTAPGGTITSPASPPKNKSDILSLFDTTPMTGPFLLAQQQQHLAAAMYAQQQYMAAAAGGAMPAMGSPTSQGPAAPAVTGLGALTGLSVPGPGSPGANSTAAAGFGGMPAAPMGVYPTAIPGAGGMPYPAPGAVPMGVYGAMQGYPGMPYMGMPYGVQAGTVPAPLDGFGMVPSGAAFAASTPSAGSTVAPQAPAASSGAAFDFSSLTAEALRK